MKKKIIKGISLAILSIIMVFCFIGCGNVEVESSGIKITDQTLEFAYCEEFTFDGKVYETFSDGSEKEITDGYTVNSEEYKKSKPGEYSVKVSYKDYTQSVTVTVKPSTVITEIFLDDTKTTFYSGDTFEYGDMRVRAKFSDGRIEYVTDFEVDSREFDGDTVGTYEITVSRNNVEKTYNVRVNRKIEEIKLENAKTEFEVGDGFKFGGAITVTYSDKSKEEIGTGYEIDSSEFNSEKTGEYTISISYGNKTISYKVNVIEIENAIDVYLIAGQSNAAGYSVKGSLNETFANVLYSGQVNRRIKDLIVDQNMLTFSTFKAVRAGLGKSSNHIGPEYGIAKAINDQYSSEHKAFIFKSAAGGTCLRDIAVGESATYGNWYPRSMWEKGYIPNIESVTNDPTGVQYLLFVENFKKVYTELVNQGYNPRVKGMAWMQGCGDLGAHSEYSTLLKVLIDDLRADLFSITKQEAVKNMPFVIGEIATTFANYNNSSVPVFNVAQRKVAESYKDGSVTTIKTSDLIIVDEDGFVVGTDRYHFNTADAVTLGQRFGTALLDLNK